MSLSSNARTLLNLVAIDEQTGEVLFGDLDKYVEAFGVDDEYTAEELLDEACDELVRSGIWDEYSDGGYFDVATADEADMLRAMDEESDRTYLADIAAAWNDAKGIW